MSTSKKLLDTHDGEPEIPSTCLEVYHFEAQEAYVYVEYDPMRVVYHQSARASGRKLSLRRFISSFLGR